MLLLNFTGPPGAGKSTMAAGLFHLLKTRHWNVELVTEYTKELILSGDQFSLADELLVFAEKYRRINTLKSVDIVITDSPLINSAVYGDGQFGDAAPKFYETVAQSFDSLYFAVERVSEYIPLGRMPDEAQAGAAGAAIVAHVEKLGAPLWRVSGHNSALAEILDIVEREAKVRSISRLRELQEVF